MKPSQRILVVTTLAFLLATPVSMSTHGGTPGVGGVDGWVDVHGDTMSGTLNMQAVLNMGANPILFNGGTLTGNPTLSYGPNAVCLANVAIAGCGGGGGSGTVTSVATGAGLTGGPITSSGTISIATGGVVSSLLADGAVTSAKVLDGTLATADLAFDPATQTELDAHKASADHDGRYFTESELQTPGTINAGGNPVAWTKLAGVPAGIADGVDADSGGDITGVTAGAGLTGGGTTGAVSLGIATDGVTSAMIQDGAVGAADVDSAAVQRRVGSCAVGQAIRSIAADGTPTCEAVGGSISTSIVTISVTIQPGQYSGSIAQCPAGKVVVGGGVQTSFQNGNWVTQSYPNSATSWQAHVHNSGTLGNPVTATIYAVCI